MYKPKHFEQSDVTAMHALIDAYSFGLAVTNVGGILEAVHVPVVLAREPAPLGTLHFHLARANPACDALSDGVELLVVFSGPHAYVSPDWYQARDLVPTWNYVAVHAYGTPRAVDDAALSASLKTLVAQNEAGLDKPPWRTDALDIAHFANLRRAIVGFEMPITSLEGKWKLGQNRSKADREGVVHALGALGTDTAQAMARLVAETVQS